MRHRLKIDAGHEAVVRLVFRQIDEEPRCRPVVFPHLCSKRDPARRHEAETTESRSPQDLDVAPECRSERVSAGRQGRALYEVLLKRRYIRRVSTALPERAAPGTTATLRSAAETVIQPARLDSTS